MWLSAALLLLVTSLPHVLGEESSYGADKSWPIHHVWTDTSEPLTEECKTAYERFMDGCGKQNVEDAVAQCELNEEYRLTLSLTQPSSMVNFTDTGYSKVRASEYIRNLLSEHFEQNKDDHHDEAWTTTDVYVNHWDDEPYLVSLEDRSLKKEIWAYTKNLLEHWTGMELRPISLYGIRVYPNGELLFQLLGCWTLFCTKRLSHELFSVRSHSFAARGSIPPRYFLYYKCRSRRGRAVAAGSLRPTRKGSKRYDGTW
jgi:hypothetical protein